jgi:anti-sigma factor RsiW
MKCEKVKEILLTYYIDDCISINLREEFYRHIENCPACRGYKLDIDKTFPRLFKEVRVESLKEEMWQNIESAILREAAPAKSRVFSIRPFLKKSVFAFATAAALLFMVISFKAINNNQRAAVSDFLSEEGRFLDSLSDYSVQNDFNQINFGTGIEEYFL